MSLRFSLIPDAAEWAPATKLPISPLAGEMAGRPEGGVPERYLSISVSGAG